MEQQLRMTRKSQVRVTLERKNWAPGCTANGELATYLV
jgi:hypothetical protein